MKNPRTPLVRLAAVLSFALVITGCASPPATPAPVAAWAMPVETLVAPPLPPATPGAFAQSTTTAAPPGPRPNPDIIPVIQSGTQGRHTAFLARIQQGPIDLLFMGDSITDFWNTTGQPVWTQYYGNLHAADFGINADKTQNVLWRLQNGEGQGFSPKVVVLMIGTNNLGVVKRGTPDSAWRGTNAEAIEGVTAVVTELRQDFPAAKILLLGIFPRGDDLLAMAQIPEVNKGLARLDDQHHVFYLDITPQFLGPDGQINLAYFQARDHLHPSLAGYTVWAEAMKDLLAKLLQ
jgi:beta-glucosidase